MTRTIGYSLQSTASGLQSIVNSLQSMTGNVIGQQPGISGGIKQAQECIKDDLDPCVPIVSQAGSFWLLHSRGRISSKVTPWADPEEKITDMLYSSSFHYCRETEYVGEARNLFPGFMMLVKYPRIYILVPKARKIFSIMSKCKNMPLIKYHMCMSVFVFQTCMWS